MKSEFDSRIYQIVSDVMGTPIANLNDESSPDTIEKWNSLNHLNLVAAVEFEFNIALDPEDMMEMLSISLIKIILEEKLAKQEDQYL